MRSQDNISDLFTKALEPHLFFPLRDIIMNVAMQHREGERVESTGGR